MYLLMIPIYLRATEESKKSEQSSEIKILKEEMKIFLMKVKDLDPDLNLPPQFEKIGRYRSKDWHVSFII